jgi:hypothetical protein
VYELKLQVPKKRQQLVFLVNCNRSLKNEMFKERNLERRS